MSSDKSSSLDKGIVSLAAPNIEIWKLLFEIHKIKVDKSNSKCNDVYSTFEKHLKNVSKDISKGCYILGQIYLELKAIKKSKQFDVINITELESCSTKLLELFGLNGNLKLKDKLQSIVYSCSSTVDHQIEIINNKRKTVSRAASISLTIAGLSFVGLYTAAGVSSREASCDYLKNTFILALSSGGLLLVSARQLAEYLGYNNSLCSITLDFLQLRQNMMDLLEYVNKFNDRLTDMVEKIKYYCQEMKKDALLVNNYFHDCESFSVKVSEMATKVKNLQITLIKMEMCTEEGTEYAGTGRVKLPTRKGLSKRYTVE